MIEFEIVDGRPVHEHQWCATGDSKVCRLCHVNSANTSAVYCQDVGTERDTAWRDFESELAEAVAVARKHLTREQFYMLSIHHYGSYEEDGSA